MNIRESLSSDDEFNKGLLECDRAQINEIKKILRVDWNPNSDTIIIILSLGMPGK